MIVGIVCGSVVAVILIAGLVYYFACVNSARDPAYEGGVAFYKGGVAERGPAHPDTMNRYLSADQKGADPAMNMREQTPAAI